MPRYISPAQFNESGGTPIVQAREYADGETFITGAPLAVSSQKLVEDTSPITGATIVGFALDKAGGRPGYDAANSPTVVTGRKQSVSYTPARRNTVFSSLLVNNSATPVAPTSADLDQQYGLKSYTIGGVADVWVVDKNLTTTNASVEIIDIDTDLNIVFWKVIEARLAQP